MDRMDKRRVLEEVGRLMDDPALIDSANVAKLDALLWILYPDGVAPGQYADLVRAVRVLDRLCATATEQRASEASGERPPAPSASDGVVQAVKDDTTEPIAVGDRAANDQEPGARLFSSLGSFSLRDAPPEKRRLVAHYASLLDGDAERDSSSG